MQRQRLLGRAAVCLLGVLLLGLAPAVQEEAQVSRSAPAPERVIGEVTATDPAAKQITLKMDAGGTVIVILHDKTLYLRVPPGETDLKKAAKITPADIGVGDRVYARGLLAEDRKSIPAAAVIVMTKADLAQKRERERADWQKRGVAGTIVALNPESKEIMLAVRSREGTKTLVVEPSENVAIRRYAPDSVRFGQAKESSFAELKVGDALRILGTKNSAGTRIKPEQIVSGSFRTIAGIITGIDVAGGEIRIADLQNKKPLAVLITAETMVRRTPPPKAAPTSTRPPESGGGTPAAGGARSGGQPAEASPPKRPQGGGRGTPAASGTPPGGQPTETPPPPNHPQEGGRDTPAAGGAAPGGRGSQGTTSDPAGGGQLDPGRMPAVSFAQLKEGEAVLVMCTIGSDPSRVTAIVMVAGVEPVLLPGPDGQMQIGGLWNFFDISVP
ncbi:MAG: hypothetical protein HYX76_00525 [Acidobacteria bacterium]|nr:hypothetical protein [Acidobacteriota bacterium]